MASSSGSKSAVGPPKSLSREEEETKHKLTRNDPREIQKYYQNFYEKNIKDGQYTKTLEEMAKIYQIATVLYDVLTTVVPAEKVDDETARYAKEVEEKKKQGEHYNILPLYAVVVKSAIMKLPEIIAAIRALRNVNNLPMPIMPEDKDNSVFDILDWLSSVFGFQMANKIHEILFSNGHRVTGGTYQTAPHGEESFLRDVITPIYEVMRKEARRNK
ncbi:Callose synthase 7 [Camellia lanceoleosa]|uniref:Callose synthase 7 n=1 Tax=Camellia lanceoleosa TaxID=1840588 RepID=A0ACC0H2M4_9ERIC|nr:Callose synthase 7 [Camellia lanceoleosa]